MQVDAGRGKLYDAFEVARAQWRAVGDLWSDQTHADFRERTWEPLEQLAGDTLRCIDRLRTILNECRRQCEGGASGSIWHE